MLKYLNRFYSRFHAQVNASAALLTFFAIFHKPIHLIFIESQQEDYISKDPRRQELKDQFEARKAKIIQLTTDIKAAEDPELKAQLKEELRNIHIARYRNFQGIAHAPRPTV